MNPSNIGNHIGATIAATSLVATYLYFSNVKPVSPPMVDSALPTATATARPTHQNTEILVRLPEETLLPSEVKSRPGPERALSTQAKQETRKYLQSDPGRELILAEKDGFGQEVRIDTAAPPPTGDNMTAKPTGQFADQIDQQSILQQAEAYGLLEAQSNWDEHEPTDENASLTLEDDFALEIDEQEILGMAQLEGYQLPEVDPDSHPPTEINELHQPDDGYAD